MNTRQLYTLRIFLPNGYIWTQSGVAYTRMSEVKAVWDKVGPHLSAGTEATAVRKEAT